MKYSEFIRLREAQEVQAQVQGQVQGKNLPAKSDCEDLTKALSYIYQNSVFCNQELDKIIEVVEKEVTIQEPKAIQQGQKTQEPKQIQGQKTQEPKQIQGQKPQ